MRTIHREVVGAFIISKDNYLLLGKGGVYKGAWIVPGGGIDDGETKYEALSREVKEETGIDISPHDVTEHGEVLTGQSEKTLRDTGETVLVKMTFYNFIVKISKPARKIKVVCDDDFIDAMWHPLDKLKDIPLSTPTATTLKKLGYL